MSDERVPDAQFTDDTISVSLRDGRVTTVPLVWYPRLLEATPSQRHPHFRTWPLRPTLPHTFACSTIAP
jgi:Protein of unknown function (DUF2442)